MNRHPAELAYPHVDTDDAINCYFAEHMGDWKLKLEFSKNFFPQHSFERKARKYIGNIIHHINFILNLPLAEFCRAAYHKWNS